MSDETLLCHDILLCYDLTHPEEDRAPFCTKVANKRNLIEGIEGVGDDMYFCDACFSAGHEILDLIQLGIDSGRITEKQMVEAFADVRAREASKVIKKGKN